MANSWNVVSQTQAQPEQWNVVPTAKPPAKSAGSIWSDTVKPYLGGLSEGLDIPTAIMRGGAQLGAFGMDKLLPAPTPSERFPEATYSARLAKMLEAGDRIGRGPETLEQAKMRQGGAMVGNLVATLPIAAESNIMKFTPAAISKTAPFLQRAATVGQNVLRGAPAAVVNRAPGGAIMGMSQPADSGSDVAQNMGLGAGLNVGIGPTATAVGYLAKKPIEGAAYLLKGAVGSNSGIGSKAIEIAYEAGKKGQAYGQAFLDNMRKQNVLPETVVKSANAAVANLRGLRQAAYKAGRKAKDGSGWAQQAKKLDFTPVDDLMNAKALTGYSDNGEMLINEDAAKTYEIIKGLVDKYKTGISKNPGYHLSAEGLDDLKKQIYDVSRRGSLKEIAGPGTLGEGVVSSITTELGNIIKAADPKYAAAMESYEAATNVLNQMEDTLRLTGRKDVNFDKSLRALQKILRDGANTNYGVLGDLGGQLERAGAPNLMAELAGQASRNSSPTGISGAVGVVPKFAAGYYLGEKTGLGPIGGVIGGTGAVLSSIPRVVGETAYKFGAGRRFVDPAVEAVKKARATAAILATQRQNYEEFK